MNRQQLDYASTRAKSILDKRLAALKRKHTTSASTLTKEEKVEALRAGEFTITDYLPYNWYDAVSFTKEWRESVDTEALAAEEKPIREAYASLMDQLVLGDTAEALALIQAFEAQEA